MTCESTYHYALTSDRERWSGFPAVDRFAASLADGTQAEAVLFCCPICDEMLLGMERGTDVKAPMRSRRSSTVDLLRRERPAPTPWCTPVAVYRHTIDPDRCVEISLYRGRYLCHEWDRGAHRWTELMRTENAAVAWALNLGYEEVK